MDDEDRLEHQIEQLPSSGDLYFILYKVTDNPLYIFMAIDYYSKRDEHYPEWVKEYLARVSLTIAKEVDNARPKKIKKNDVANHFMDLFECKTGGSVNIFTQAKNELNKMYMLVVKDHFCDKIKDIAAEFGKNPRDVSKIINKLEEAINTSSTHTHTNRSKFSE